MNQETQISFNLNTARNTITFKQKKLKIHLELSRGVSECGFWQGAKTTKDKNKVTCKLCLKIIQ